MESLLLPLLLMLVVAVPLVLGTRRQKKAMQKQQDLQKNLDEGDRVMTTSGLYATVSDVSNDTTIDLEIAPGVVTTWLRQGVREKVAPEAEEDAVDEGSDTPDTVEGAEVEPEQTPSVLASDEQDRSEGVAEVAPPLEHGKK